MKLLHTFFAGSVCGTQITKKLLLKSGTLFQKPYLSHEEAWEYFRLSKAENTLSDKGEQEAMGERDCCFLCDFMAAGSPIAAVIINDLPR